MDCPANPDVIFYFYIVLFFNFLMHFSKGLVGARPSKKPLISTKNARARLKFAQAHKDWSIGDWSRVLWSDESKFNLFSSDGIRYVRRPSGSRNDKKYQVPTVKHGGGSIMVWGNSYIFFQKFQKLTVIFQVAFPSTALVH